MISTNSNFLRVRLSSAITTAQFDITGHYVVVANDGTVSNIVQINTETNGTTPVIIVPSAYVGTASILKNLQIHNNDTVANTVIIEQFDGTASKTISETPLDVTQSIQINADGDLSVIPAAGGGTGSGTVTSVHGTGTVSGITLTGTVTTAGNLTLGGTLAVTPSNFASQAANTFLSAPNGAAGVPNFRTIVAADVPTLNQNTTGNAATATLASTVTTNANLTGDVTSVGNATTLTNAPVIAKVLTGYTSGAGTVSAADSILSAIQKLNGNDGLKQDLSGKDASGGYPGLTSLKLNLRNAANTFTNFFTNATTAARTWTMQDKDYTVAGIDDLSVIFHVQDQRASGTAGGATTAGVNVRPLQTIVTNTAGGSLASNRPTLPAGTYKVTGSSRIIMGDSVKAYLYNITDAAIAINGQSCFAASTFANAIEALATFNGIITIAASKTFEFRTYCQTARATNGLGVAAGTGNPEIYADLIFQKIG